MNNKISIKEIDTTVKNSRQQDQAQMNSSLFYWKIQVRNYAKSMQCLSIKIGAERIPSTHTYKTIAK